MKKGIAYADAQAQGNRGRKHASRRHQHTAHCGKTPAAIDQVTQGAQRQLKSKSQAIVAEGQQQNISA